MWMQISVNKKKRKELIQVVDTAYRCGACGCRWGMWTCWYSDTLHVHMDELHADADKCKEEKKRNLPVGTHGCVVCACRCVACRSVDQLCGCR